MKSPLRAILTCLIFVMSQGVLAASPASAQSPLPTSTLPATGEWRVMRPSTFAGTIASAVEQCERDAKLDDNDRLRLDHCVVLRDKLTVNDCAVVMVPDGIVHDFMNGRQNGRSFVTRNVKKKLGRSDRALVCDLGGGVHAYWYTGVRGQSCNNVGFTIVIPPMPFTIVPPEPPPAPPSPPKPKCKVVAIRQQDVPQGFNFLPGVFLPPGCCPECTPGMYIQALVTPDLLHTEPGVTYVTVCE